MVRKKLDGRIKTLIENGVLARHRSMFVIVGDKGRDQVVILHHILSKAAVAARPSVLWCYKKELGFSSHRKKRMKELQKKIKSGKLNIKEDDPFELFIASTQIRYCYYSETHKILGNTFGMCVLQDYEALTPNLLARTIETVEGGGLVVILLRSVDSLRQLFTITMDVHSRYRTEAHSDVVARFNERFILSLSAGDNCLVVDDALNVLPLCSRATNIEPLPRKHTDKLSASKQELDSLVESMIDTKPVGDLLKRCKTACQAKVVLKLLDLITEKTLQATASITAPRGRGKSAALGLAISGAISFGYSNIFITSPSPENLKTLFEFVLKGFDAVGLEEHSDYELIQSTNPEFNKALVRINVFRDHRQTIQYIRPCDGAKLGQAELMVIDEAAAIPLPMVKQLLGPYLVFMASTVNGYEGTGRSLSLKLLQQLRQQAVGSGTKSDVGAGGRRLCELALEESIRYAPGDGVETWLNRLLCLDASAVTRLISGCPPPADCQLYYVNRDTLFSFHKASEAFLQRLMAIYVAAHYKNTPNDLQMLSDAPAHHLFVLLGPVKLDQTTLPEILVVLQVCLEGEISRESVKSSLQRGKRAAGDLIPWTVAQQFQDNSFPTLSGARVVRIATHPDYQSMGYGRRALELLQEYYQGHFTDFEAASASVQTMRTVEDEDTVGLLEESVQPRKHLPPLLLRLQERSAENLDYLGVSYGLTLPLLKFWKRTGFTPVYLRQTQNELTGEHSCIMLKRLNNETELDGNTTNWLRIYWDDFRGRLVNLFSFEFAKFPTAMALSILEQKKMDKTAPNALSRDELSRCLSNRDLHRLERYADATVDYHLITDLLPAIARLYFTRRLTQVKLNPVQMAILLGLGLQHKTVDELATELQHPLNQVLALFNQGVKKLVDHFNSICEKAIEGTLLPSNGEQAASHMTANKISLDEELETAAADFERKQEENRTKVADLVDFSQYTIKGSEEDWKSALDGTEIGKKTGGILSVKGERKRKTESNLDEFLKKEAKVERKPKMKKKGKGKR